MEPVGPLWVGVGVLVGVETGGVAAVGVAVSVGTGVTPAERVDVVLGHGPAPSSTSAVVPSSAVHWTPVRVASEGSRTPHTTTTLSPAAIFSDATAPTVSP